MRLVYFLLLIVMVVSACEETVELDINNSEPVFAVEGLVTDQLRNHYVRVTESVDFYADNGSNPIDNAVVTVSDGTNTFDFDHNPSQIVETEGYYFSRLAFRGEVGKTYDLRVEVGGNVFTATDELFPVAPIDTLTSIINDDEFDDPETPGYFYEILFNITEPQETDDYYLFKFYRNDTLLQDDTNDIYFSNDDLLAENISGVPTAGFFRRFDTGTVEVYSISNSAFIYFNDLTNLLNSDGGLFGAPPVNPRTNIRGGALGYFQTSSVDSESLQILN